MKSDNINSIIFVCVLILFVLVSFVPFNYLQHIKVFNVPFYYIYIGGFVLFLTLLTWFNDNFKINMYDRWLLILCLGFLLSLISSVDKSMTLQTTGSFVLRGIAVSFIASRVINSDKRWRSLLIGAISIVSVVCLIGLVEYLTGKIPIWHNLYILHNTHYIRTVNPYWRGGIASTIGYSTPLGAYLVLFLPLSLLVIRQNRLIFYYIPFILIMFAIIFSFARSAYLASIVCLVWYFFSKGNYRLNKKSVFVLVLLIFVSGIIFAFSPRTNLIYTRRLTFAKLSEEISYDAHRIGSLKTTFNILKEKPFFGVGLGNYAKVRGIYWLGNQGDNIKTPDSIYLSLFCETGIIGTSIFLLFILRCILFLWRGYTVSEDMSLLAVLIGIVGFLICSIAGEFFGWMAPQYAFWMLLGAGMGMANMKVADKIKQV